MVRSVLSSCLLLTVVLGACGGSKGIGVKIPQVGMPGPSAYDGSAPAKGTVTFISPLPGGDGSQFVAYEVDPTGCAVKRTFVDDLEALQKLIIVRITDPMDNAGTLSIIRPSPPPPPTGEDLVRDARFFAGTTGSCQLQKPSSPTHQ